MELSLILVALPIALMVIFGVPHGALDGAIIVQAFPTFRQRSALLLGYLLLSAVCVLVWLTAPTLCLGIFLLLSAWHFGRSDQARGGQLRPDHRLLSIGRTLADGGIWVLLVPYAHQSAVREVFVTLGVDASLIMQAIDWLILPWALLATVSVAERMANGLSTHAMIALSFAGLSVITPPLWSLCIYFCAWHSRRHVIRVLSDLQSPKLGWISMISLTVVTVVMALMAAVWLPVSALWTTAMTQIFFIGLFALTVPHMLLIDLYLPFARPAGQRGSFNSLDYSSR